MTDIKYIPNTKIVNLIGNRYARLSVTDYVGNYKWLCLCDCGNTKVIPSKNFKKGITKSCGCLQKQLARKRLISHGKSKTSEFYILDGIKGRCKNPLNKDYLNYGGRGITICDRWLGKDGFANFFSDMGLKPTPKHSIDRIDNIGNYEPSNCRWATMKEQARNRQRAITLKIDGKNISLKEACEKYNIKYITAYKRITKGYCPEDSIKTPAGSLI